MSINPQITENAVTAHSEAFHDDFAITSEQVIVADELVLWALGSREGEYPGDAIGECAQCWRDVAMHLANWLTTKLGVAWTDISAGSARWHEVIAEIKNDIAEIRSLDEAYPT